MRPRLQGLFSLAIVVLAAWALLSTRAWPIKTALYPRAVGVPLLLLAAAEFVLSLRPPKASTGEQAIDFALSEEVEPKLALRRTINVFAWILGFFLAIVLLGFPVAIPLFVLAYLKGPAKERWTLALVLAGFAWVAFYGLFIRLLHLPFGEGLLFRVLN